MPTGRVRTISVRPQDAPQAPQTHDPSDTATIPFGTAPDASRGTEGASSTASRSSGGPVSSGGPLDVVQSGSLRKNETREVKQHMRRLGLGGQRRIRFGSFRFRPYRV